MYSRKFDILSYQFPLQYFFATVESVKNVIDVDIHHTYINENGFIICTLIEANRVFQVLNGKET